MHNKTIAEKKADAINQFLVKIMRAPLKTRLKIAKKIVFRKI